MEVSCPSRIARVSVYGRGAVVTRAVALPATLPEEAFDLVVPGVTALSSPGTARASVSGSREVPTVRMRLVVPPAPSEAGPLTERVRALAFERERLETEQRQLLAQKQKIAGLTPEARLQSRWRKIDPALRVEDALAACGIASELGAAIDARLFELTDALEQNARDRAAAELAERQGRSADRVGAGHPIRDIVAHVARGDAQGLSSLEVSYVVAAARWWPAYAVRLSDVGRHAAWALEAFVAQASGEDWDGVGLSLCSASLVREVRLPELPSLRLGRSQPAPRRGYRPPPPGTDELFAGYDAARRAPKPAAPPPPPAAARAPAPPAEEEDTKRMAAFAAAPHALAYGAPAGQGVPFPSAAPSPSPPRAMAPPAAMAPMAGAPAMPRRASAKSAAEAASIGGGGMRRREEPDTALREADTSPGLGSAAPDIEPTDAWLDFDSLAMAKSDAGPSRGRLVLDPGTGGSGEIGGVQTRASFAVEKLSPARAVDPQDQRQDGFDVRYEARVPADVPSNAQPHRVPVDSAEGSATPRFVVVPREAATVYRESVAKSPFRFPLLPGPVDIFESDSLLLTTTLEATGPGGNVVLGLGAEERVRVARNARADEGTGGLLGGTTTVDHAVSVDLSSSLGHAITVEVFERLPETDDKDVAIELRTASPAPVRYDQAERGRPIRGGLRWTVPLPPAGTQRIELAYRVTLPAKSEIIGGNRRE